jgi:hypothetical protein
VKRYLVSDEEEHHKIQNEAKVHIALESDPQFETIHDYNEDDNFCYLVMERCLCSLADTWCQKEDPELKQDIEKINQGLSKREASIQILQGDPKETRCFRAHNF